ncbi:MAG: hypothetical protein KAI95_04505 [Bacteroidales bacterium]|nr:hypothetical protein [Bacteroidales bacterium]
MLFVRVHYQGMVENPDFASWEPAFQALNELWKFVQIPRQSPDKGELIRGLFVS